MFNKLYNEINEALEDYDLIELTVDGEDFSIPTDFWNKIREALIERSIIAYAGANVDLYDDMVAEQWPNNLPDSIDKTKKIVEEDGTDDWFIFGYDDDGNSVLKCPSENTDANETGPWLGFDALDERVEKDWFVDNDVKRSVEAIWDDVDLAVLGP